MLYSISFQNDTFCLPAWLDCYTNLAPDNCNTTCKGIFADRTWKDAEDLEKNADFYNDYKNYKSGFTKNEGKQYKISFLMTPSAMLLVFEKKTALHLFRIRFETFSYDIITKDIKVKFFDKFSHFGGTAGLFTGFSYISIFEFLIFIFKLFYGLYLFLKNYKKTSEVVNVQEFQPKEASNEFEKNVSREIFDIKQKLEYTLKKNEEKIDAIEKILKRQESKEKKVDSSKIWKRGN